VCRRDHQPVSGYAATVIMVGWAMSAANNILAADTDTPFFSGILSLFTPFLVLSSFN